MSYVRMSTDNPLGFRPWASRLSGLSGVESLQQVAHGYPPPNAPNIRVQWAGGVGQYVWRPAQSGGTVLSGLRRKGRLGAYGPVELYVPSATTPGGAAYSHLPASLSLGAAEQSSGETATWGGAALQMQNQARVLYQDLQKKIAMPVFGNVPLLYIAGGALAFLAFLGGRRR